MKESSKTENPAVPKSGSNQRYIENLTFQALSRPGRYRGLYEGIFIDGTLLSLKAGAMNALSKT